MPLSALRRAIDSCDDYHLYTTVRACGAHLRERGTRGEDALVSAIVELANHRSTTVRQAVADVCDALPDDTFDTTHARLLADGDPYVRRAAEAAGHRHAQGLRHAAREKAEDAAFDDLLGEIERAAGKNGKKARRLAEQAIDRGIERFARGMAHEVDKTKDAVELSLIKLASEVDRPGRSTVTMHEHIALLRERAAFVYAIVRRATEYATRNEPAFADESLAEVVREVVAQLLGRMKARASRVALSVEIDPALRLHTDRHAMKQALQNALQNAVEAYPASAERLPVRVAARTLRGGSEVELTVADEGVGIPESEMASLFVPFGSRKAGGTGVGMLILRRMIEEVHGGTLRIASVEGKGTTVTMVLPAKQERG